MVAEGRYQLVPGNFPIRKDRGWWQKEGICSQFLATFRLGRQSIVAKGRYELVPGKGRHELAYCREIRKYGNVCTEKTVDSSKIGEKKFKFMT